jgi:hypothetical protein
LYSKLSILFQNDELNLKESILGLIHELDGYSRADVTDEDSVFKYQGLDAV